MKQMNPSLRVDGQRRKASLKILILTRDLADNSLGRTYVLWLLARHLGWEVAVRSIQGEQIWAPLAGSVFAGSCARSVRDSRGRARLLGDARSCDLIIAAKPLPETLGIASRLARQTSKALLLDIDDPDLESRLGTGRWWEVLGKSAIRPKTFWPTLTVLPKMVNVPRTVSNPSLAKRYGGVVIPHARVDSGSGCVHTRTAPKVVFVGTNRRHKGIEVLRRAVSALESGGFTLVITDEAPNDAKKWETWVGVTSLEQGKRLVREGDIVVLVNDSPSIIPRFQLPAKLMDAMLAGRAIVTSEQAPLLWALGGHGYSVKGEDDLISALTALRNPEVRSRMGQAARERALSLFTVEACAPAFEEACRHAVTLTS